MGTSSALGGFYIPNMSGVFDWNFFWNVVQNWLSSESPFVLIVAAGILVASLLTLIVRGLRNR